MFQLKLYSHFRVLGLMPLSYGKKVVKFYLFLKKMRAFVIVNIASLTFTLISNTVCI